MIYKLSAKTLGIKNIGKINLYSYKNKLENNINFVITKGYLNPKKSVPVRVLSNLIKKENILNNKNIKKSLKIMSKYKNYLLLIINNKNNISKRTTLTL